MLCFYGLLFAFDTSPRYVNLKNAFFKTIFNAKKKKKKRCGINMTATNWYPQGDSNP